ncbi:DNA polymerase [Vibrio phage vB_VpaM_VPs20]|uniref:DNA polymerase n=1 Tax=Vibrio phage vB_VpaM_VPs20 TaxID=2978980 RepID=A0A9X9JRG0_9CAUD|nr:DNA polymerase [Vibrio phage vB_VpaM_VPs20]UYD72104.1 DNA polymerase [Vibrio phage vB_VpaM_VPs20]
MENFYQMQLDRPLVAADIETTGLLHDLERQGESRKMHNFGAKFTDGTELLFTQAHNTVDSKVCKDIRPISELQDWLNQGWNLIMHNGITYDAIAMTKYFELDLSKCVVLDTLYMAWYLEPDRHRYGLADYGEMFGVPKPPIEDWQNLHISEYGRRVMQDCRIQLKLWSRLWKMMLALYEDDVAMAWKMVAHLNMKGRHLAKAQETKWKLDVPNAEKYSAEWAAEKEARTTALIEVMPLVPEFKEVRRPKKPFKMNGQLSGTWEDSRTGKPSLGIKWALFCLNYDVDFDDANPEGYLYHDSDKPGNPNSPAQLKEWLFSLGWEPETFEYKRNDDGSERAIPQINVKNSGGELDPGVERLIEDHPTLERLKGLSIVKHRLGIVNGWLRDHKDGWLEARAAGFTNTLRLRHAEIVNVPSDRVWGGKELRSLLIAPDGYVSLGSDLSSLEDRCKHHYQMPLDPEYVKSQLTKGFDPHLTIAVLGSFITQADYDLYVAVDNEEIEPTEEQKARIKEIKPVRALGKRTNYGCQYGARPPRLARDAKIEMPVAQRLFDAYWDLNWSINEIADSMEVKTCGKYKWQRNPANGFWYYLKHEKDRFSTLCQGTGAWVFDTWVEMIHHVCRERWGKEPLLCGQFHDEVIIQCKSGTEKLWTEILLTAMDRTNAYIKMRRDMACDIQFGTHYAQIH